MYVNSALLLLMKENNINDPENFYRLLMEHCMTARILKMDGLSRTGARYTVGVLSAVQASVYCKFAVFLL